MAPDDVGGELAALERGCVHERRVGGAEVGADDRVLPAGHADRVQVALRLEQREPFILCRRLGGEARDERHRTLVQRAGWRTVGIPLDANVGRFWGRGVERGRGGRAARERAHRTAAARDPLAAGRMRARVPRIVA
jgi:hypothetical protein